MPVTAWLAIVSLALSSFVPTPDPASEARALLERSIQAMGGDALKRITSVQLETRGHAYAIEQSERPEGPFIVIYTQSKELRDYAGRRARVESQTRSNQSPEWGPPLPLVMSDDVVAYVRGDRAAPASRANLET